MKKSLSGFVRNILVAIAFCLPFFALVGTADAQVALPADTTACETAMMNFVASARCTGVPATGAVCAEISNTSDVMLRACSGLREEVVSCMNDVARGVRRITGTSQTVRQALNQCTQVPAVATVSRPRPVTLNNCPSGQHLNAGHTACLCDEGQHSVYTRRGGLTGLHVCVPGTAVPGDANFSRYAQRLTRLEQQLADHERRLAELENRHRAMCPSTNAAMPEGCRDIPGQLERIRALLGAGAYDDAATLMVGMSRRVAELESVIRGMCAPREGEGLSDACLRFRAEALGGRAARFEIGATGLGVFRVGSTRAQPSTFGATADLGLSVMRSDWRVGVRFSARFGGADFGLNAGGVFMAGGSAQLLIPLTMTGVGRQLSTLTFNIGAEGYGFFVAGTDTRGSQVGAFRGFLLGGSAGASYRPVDWMSFNFGVLVGYDRNAVRVGSNIQTTSGVGIMPQLGLNFTF